MQAVVQGRQAINELGWEGNYHQHLDYSPRRLDGGSDHWHQRHMLLHVDLKGIREPFGE